MGVLLMVVIAGTSGEFPSEEEAMMPVFFSGGVAFALLSSLHVVRWCGYRLLWFGSRR
jgi:hypothetical protein